MKLSSFRCKKNQRGISLLEVMLSLAIIAIILVMATRYFGIAMRGSKVNQAVSEVGEIQQGFIRYQSDKGNLTGATLTVLSNDGYITARTAGGTNPWGGNYTPTTTANPPTLAITGIPNPDCQNLGDKFNVTCTGGTVTVNLLGGANSVTPPPAP